MILARKDTVCQSEFIYGINFKIPTISPNVSAFCLGLYLTAIHCNTHQTLFPYVGKRSGPTNETELIGTRFSWPKSRLFGGIGRKPRTAVAWTDN